MFEKLQFTGKLYTILKLGLFIALFAKKRSEWRKTY